MKTMTAILVAVLVLVGATCPPACEAGGGTEEETELELRSSVKWNALAAPAYLFGQLVFHEGVHLVTNEVFGFRTKSFEPYPHVKDGSFYFTYVEAWPKDGKHFVSRDAAMRYWRDEVVVMLMMPYVVDTTLMAASGALLATGAVEPGSVGGLVLYTAGMVVPWVDIFMNVNVFPLFRRSRTDFGDTFNLVGTASFVPIMVAAEAALIAGGVAIVMLGRDVLFEKKPKAVFSKVALTPFAAKGVLGAGLAFQF